MSSCFRTYNIKNHSRIKYNKRINYYPIPKGPKFYSISAISILKLLLSFVSMLVFKREKLPNLDRVNLIKS
ncbi:unnamed protein product [Rhizophagus irregularis]|nr:unnamed protein product [Rhizophagus irregularis]